MDLETPTFSDPTSITNPLFPRDAVTQVVQLGVEGEDELRFEITYLPDTKFIRWNGQRVETRVTHFVAYMNGRILEVATDFYAQADDGAVWYFGENVDNYENGVIVDHEGTWLAGRDGPPGMIMPGDPQVGDVFRPENIPGLVFEQVTVRRTGFTVAGPRGPVSGAIAVRERLMDGTTEDKQYAPGYGEFRAEVKTEAELYHVAVASPIDSLGTCLLGWALNGPLKFTTAQVATDLRSDKFADNALVPEIGDLFGVKPSADLSLLLPLGLVVAGIIWFLLKRACVWATRRAPLGRRRGRRRQAASRSDGCSSGSS